jgi:tetratricopeptide (TPR) repeat protein
MKFLSPSSLGFSFSLLCSSSIWSLASSSSSSSNEQPSQYHIAQTASCCQYIDNSTLLMNCIDEIEPPETTGESRIAILTYASPGIFDYAAYAFAVNSAYAEHNGYEIFFLTPETGSNYEPRDQRWNRVKIIQEALDPSNGWLRDIQYIAWVDADLIFLDLDFSLEKLTRDYPHADMIISAERHAETGVANTGSFIVKNSPWTHQLLHDWWTKYDRSLNHDQIFFDKLYKSRMPDIQNHVKILPTTAMNSMPPPTLYQTAEDKVLHMMGQPNLLRKKVFRLGFEEICYSYEANEEIENQLGLSQSVLYSMGIQHYENELSELISKLEKKDYLESISSETYLQEASLAREDALQINLFNPDVDQSDVVNILFQSAQHKLRHVESLADPSETTNTQLFSTRFLQSTEGRYLPSLYNAVAVYGNDLLKYIPDLESKRQLILLIETALTRMELLLPRHQMHIPREMKLRLYSTMGHLEFDSKEFEKSVPYFKKSIEMLEEMGDKANQVYAVDPLMSIGSSYCMMDASTLDEGISYFQKAIAVQEKLLFAEQQWKQDHLTLATAFLRFGGCLAKARDLREAKRVLSRAYDILIQHPEKETSSFLLEGWKRIDERVMSELQMPHDLQFVEQLETDRLNGKYKSQSYTDSIKHLSQGKNAHSSSKSTTSSSSSSTSSSNVGGGDGKIRKMMRKKKKSTDEL